MVHSDEDFSLDSYVYFPTIAGNISTRNCYVKNYHVLARSMHRHTFDIGFQLFYRSPASIGG